MKKTLVLYSGWTELHNWEETNGARTYRARGLTRAKIDTKLYLLVEVWRGVQHWVNRLRSEQVVEIIWLAEAKQRASAEDLQALQLLLPARFNPKKALPDRDMGLHGLAQFHSIAVRIRTAANGRIKTRKAWYMFHTKKWVYEGTVEKVEPVEWYTPWFEGA